MAKSRGRKSLTRTVDSSTLPLFASAMRRAEPAADLVRVEGRPDFLSCGLKNIDRPLGGGFPVGGLTLVAARATAGATSFFIGAALGAVGRGERVAYFSERIPIEQLRGRFVVLESRVNGFRVRAGFLSAEDRLALAAARERIPWNSLGLVCRRTIHTPEIDGHIFSYRPWLVLADIKPKAPEAQHARGYEGLVEGVQRLRQIAARHKIALVLRWIMPKGRHRAQPEELPQLGDFANYFDSALFLHRDEIDEADANEAQNVGRAAATIFRLKGRRIEPREAPLRFDQRFAGLFDAP